MKTNNSATLYELTGNWLALYEMADDPETDPQAFFDTMEGLEGEIEDKADGYAAVIAKLENDANSLKAYEDKCKAKRKAIENSITRMKYNLGVTMQTTGKTKFKTLLWSYYFKKSDSVKLDAEVDKLPEEFLRYKAPEANKDAIKAAINAGRDLTGIAHIETNESLVIR